MKRWLPVLAIVLGLEVCDRYLLPRMSAWYQSNFALQMLLGILSLALILKYLLRGLLGTKFAGGGGICPRCGTADHVLPIVYGDTEEALRLVRSGQAICGGCVGDKEWFCKGCRWRRLFQSRRP